MPKIVSFIRLENFFSGYFRSENKPLRQSEKDKLKNTSMRSETDVRIFFSVCLCVYILVGVCVFFSVAWVKIDFWTEDTLSSDNQIYDRCKVLLK